MQAKQLREFVNHKTYKTRSINISQINKKKNFEKKKIKIKIENKQTGNCIKKSKKIKNKGNKRQNQNKCKQLK